MGAGLYPYNRRFRGARMRAVATRTVSLTAAWKPHWTAGRSAAVLGPMDIHVKVGQLFFVGFDGAADGPALRDYLGEVRPGGLIHFARNIESADQVTALNGALQTALDEAGSPSPFVSVDQEGGRVSRLRRILPPLPSAAQLVPAGEARITGYGRALGEALAALGFNADFAPVVDLSSPGAVNGIGDRSFGRTPPGSSAARAPSSRGSRRRGSRPGSSTSPGSARPTSIRTWDCPSARAARTRCGIATCSPSASSRTRPPAS
jgi:beta-N-acetylhexosaminidase